MPEPRGTGMARFTLRAAEEVRPAQFASAEGELDGEMVAIAVLDGRQPRNLTAEKLLEHSRLPLAWHDQRTLLGFA